MPSYTAQPLSATAGPVPPPTAGPTEQMEPSPDPTGQKPHGYYRDKFFGTLGTIDKSAEWSGHTNTVSLRILEADEARACARYAFVRSEGHPTSDDYLLAATICRIAYSLQAVDGVPVSSECTTFEQRLQMAAELSETLQDALIAAYDEARYEPIAFLQEMADTPGFAQTPTENGSSSVGVPSPQEA